MHRWLLPAFLALFAYGCEQGAAPQQTTDARNRAGGAVPGPPADTDDPLNEAAAAQLQPTQGQSTYGSLMVARAPEGVRVNGAVQALPPNAEFGFHVHEKGDCSAPDASSAGEHFNPTDQPHGDPTGDKHHAGDMQNLRSDNKGVAQVDVTLRGVTLHTGETNDIFGKAIVVHAKPDDYSTQPSGESGPRIACGVITFLAGTDAQSAAQTPQ